MIRRLGLLLLVLLAMATPAHAAFTFVQGDTDFSGGLGTTVSITLGGVTAGNLVVVWIGHGSAATTITVSDGTSSLTGATLLDDDVRVLYGRFAYILSSVASGTVTYTATFGTSVNARAIAVMEFSYTGTATLNAENNTASGTTPTTPTSGVISTTGASTVVLGAQINSNNSVMGTPTISGVAADTFLPAGSVNSSVGIWYRLLSSTVTDATAAVAISGGSGVNWMVPIIAFSSSADSGSPIDPTNLVASATTSNAVDLTWTASTDDVGILRYEVQRCAGVSCTNFVAVASPTLTNTTDPGLTASTAYRYQVRAFDTSLNASGFSSRATATTLNTRSITLNWADNATNETGFLIRRCVTTSGPCQPAAPYATISTANVTNYADTTSSRPISCYDLQATNAQGGSTFSNVACTTDQSFATLTLANAGTGSGVASPSGSNSYATGTVVNLSAIAAIGSDFGGFGGDADCTDGSVTITGTTNCTATFTRQTGQFAYVASRGTTNNKTAGTTLTISPAIGATISKNNLLIVRAVADNTATQSGTSGEHVVSDSLGNQYVKLIERTNAGAGANSGVTVSIWASRPFASISATNTITLTLSNAHVAKAIGLEEFTLPASVTFTNATSVGTNGTSTTPSAVIAGLASAFRLFVGLVGIEADITATPTQANGYASGTAVNGTSGGGSTTNVATHLGFKRQTSTGDTFAPTLPAAVNWATVYSAIGTTTETNSFVVTTSTTGAGGGAVTGSGRYYGGSTVRIEATPDASSGFGGWATIAGDTCTSASNTVVFFTLTQNTECRATFNATPTQTNYTLTIATAGSGTGSTTGAGVYAQGTVVGMTAAPAVTSFFSGWTPGVCSTGSVTMTADITCTATFTLLATYTMTTSSTGSGLGSTSGSGVYSQGQLAAISATPNAGSAFVGWSGSTGCIASSASLNVLMDANKTCAATFASQAAPPFGTLIQSAPKRCSVNLTASITSAVGVAEVIWRVDGVAVLSQATSPYRLYRTLLNESQQITAEVRDLGGQTVTLGPHTVVCP